MTNIFIGVFTALSLLSPAAESESPAKVEGMTCEMVPLDEYGFGGYDTERVCVNVDDYTDFIIVTGYETGDIIEVNEIDVQ